MGINSKTTSKRIFDFLALLLVGLGIWIIIREAYINPRKLEKDDSAYTVAVITDFSTPSEGDKEANFIYTVHANKYEGFFSIYKKNIRIGDRYFVKFLKSDPSIKEFLFDSPVPDSIKNVPDAGWPEIP